MPRRRQTRKQKQVDKHKGGKYVGEGSYGCGYLPALRCEDESERTPGMFSKLMDAGEASKEYEIGEKWFKPVDPKQQYFLYPYKICPINQAVLPNPENNTDTCQDKFNSLDDAMLLQFVNGGIDITKLPLEAEDYLPYFAAFKNLFDGLSYLHSYDIAHMDIKTGNIVGQKNSANSFLFRFIDFGLSINSDISRYPYNDSRYEGSYYPWPFETRFIVDGFDKSQITSSRVQQFFIAASINNRYIPWDIYYLPDNKTPKLNADFFRDLYDRFQGIDYYDKLATVTNSTDVYSLGIVLSTMYSKRIGHFYHHSVRMCLDPRDLTRRILLTDLQPLVSADIYAWHVEVFEKISLHLYRLVKWMMNLEAYNRLNIDDARNIYIRLLPEMARLFKPELIRKGLSIYKPELAVGPAPSAPVNTPKPFSLSPLKARNKTIKKPKIRPNAPFLIPSQLKLWRSPAKNK